MLRPRRVSVKNGAIFTLVIAIVFLILSIVLFSSSNPIGGGVCLGACFFFLVPAIICYNKYRKAKLAIQESANREKALSEITDALINDLGIDCSDDTRKKVKYDVTHFIYYLSEEEIEQQKANPNTFNCVASRASFCCVNSPDSLLALIHAIIIYHHLNLPQQIEKIRVSNNILPVNWSVVKKQVFHIIEEHLINHKDDPFYSNSEEFTEKIKQVLAKSTYIRTGEIRINRKESQEEQGN